MDGSISDYTPGSMQASAVYKAYEYAAKMGAHVISFSIAPTLGQGGLGLTSLTTSQGIKPPYPWNITYAAQNLSYITAIKPLQDKNMLLVAAAGVGVEIRCGEVLTKCGHHDSGQLHPTLSQLHASLAITAAAPPRLVPTTQFMRRL